MFQFFYPFLFEKIKVWLGEFGGGFPFFWMTEDEKIEVNVFVSIKGPPTKIKVGFKTGHVDIGYLTFKTFDPKYVVESINILVDYQPEMNTIITGIYYYRSNPNEPNDKSIVYQSITEETINPE